jgi:DNA-binding MarR family transcriptional regulator
MRIHHRVKEITLRTVNVRNDHLASAGEEDAAGLIDAWRELEALHATVIDSLERELQRHHGIGRHEYEVLVQLVSDRCRISDLALDVHISQSAASRLIDRLEEMGLASRTICSDDRRGVYACATEAGRARAEAAHATEQEVLARLLPAHLPGSVAGAALLARTSESGRVTRH